MASDVWWRWFLWSAAGEVIGFVAPAVAGVLTGSSSVRVAMPALVGAGAVEGAVLGWAQSRALSPLLPGLDARRLVAATAVAAAVAYAVGMGPAALVEAGQVPPFPWPIIGAFLGGILVLGSIGTAQWMELRRCLPHCSSWVLTTALAWAIGLGVFGGVAMPLWHEGQSALVSILIGVAGGVCMAASVAAVTGLALLRLLHRNRGTPERQRRKGESDGRAASRLEDTDGAHTGHDPRVRSGRSVDLRGP